MGSDYIKFEGGSFLKCFVESHESEEHFLETANTKGYQHLFEDDPERENKLRALYAKVTKKKEDAPPAAADTEGGGEIAQASAETAEKLSAASAEGSPAPESGQQKQPVSKGKGKQS